MSPFHHLSEADRQNILQICECTHSSFIEHVKKHRAHKLSIDDKMFTGEIYTGEEGKSNGLVDDIGTMVDVLNRKYPGTKL